MLVSAGKHYINIEEISTIRCMVDVSISGNPISSYYEICMKNGHFLKISKEDFDNFKEKCGRLSKNVF